MQTRAQKTASMITLAVFIILAISAFFISNQMLKVGATIFLTSIFLTGGAVFIYWLRSQVNRIVASQTLNSLIQAEQSVAFLTNINGQVINLNSLAKQMSEGQKISVASDIFSRNLANPQSIALRLQAHAENNGFAEDKITIRNGQLNIFVAKVNKGLFLWRIEQGIDMSLERESAGLPSMTVGPSGTVLFMNEAFRKLAGKNAKNLQDIFGVDQIISGRSYTIGSDQGWHRCIAAAVPSSAGRIDIYLLPEGQSLGNSSWDEVEDLPVPLLKVAKNGELLATNREARQLLGEQADQALRLSDLLEGLGRPIIEWIKDVSENKTLNTREFLRGTGDKQDFFVQVALHNAGIEEDRHLIAVLNDMTEFKSLEAQFVQSQKMQAIGQLAGGVAHDFNNLLTAISGHCDFLLLRHDQGDQDYADLIQIHQNANRAASLVGQLLAFSRKQNLNPEVIDLRDTLADLTHLLNRLVGEKIKLILDHDLGLFRIRVDKRQLEQVIMNLVVNARDAMPGGGEIKVETNNIELKKQIHRDRAVLPAGHYVLVRVIDEGHGISEEKRNKIFEPFYTTKQPGKGTGLGLSTAYGIVKQSGGFIFADSQIGEGSVFSLYFPICNYNEIPKEVKIVKNNPSTVVKSGRGVVLLVEDEAPVRAFASRALRLKGLTVIEAESGEMALSMIADPNLHIDIFVTDVIMPGIDGPTWVSQAIEDRPEVKVIFVSGYAEDAFGEHRAQIPNSVFLPKPFSLAELTSTVQGQLN